VIAPPKPCLRIAIVGVGKIAREQHVPAIAINPRFALAATASAHSRIADVPAYAELAELIARERDIDAVAICTPPQVRYEIAKTAIAAGLHVLLEKPPGATIAEVGDLARRAKDAGVTLFATWHSRSAAGVETARTWLQCRRILSVRIDWREDIRVWHPGQRWILDAGGMGVFDPGINALSIATHILPGCLIVETATLRVPRGAGAPIAATLRLSCSEARVDAEFDFLQTGPQIWDIVIETDGGLLRLSDGGRTLSIDGDVRSTDADAEYPDLYRQMATLIDTGTSDVDLRPLKLVADAYMVGVRQETEAFTDF